MNPEMITAAIESLSNEKGLDKEELYTAMESALSASAQTGEKKERRIRTQIDRMSGEYKLFRCWEVVEDDELVSEEREIPFSKASKKYKDIDVGDVIEESLESTLVSSRIAAQIAKKVIQQKLREAEGHQMIANYSNRVGEIVRGVVRYIEPNGVTVDLGNTASIFIPKEKQIPIDLFRVNDRTQCLLHEVREEGRPPFLIGTRTSNAFLDKLFTAEVPEISQGHIQIVNSAREPGIRAKIAVKSLDPKLDPIGSCVGIRGSRVQTVSNELAGERIDVVLWNDNLAEFVVNAMAPAKTQSIILDEEKGVIDVVVDPDSLSQAIGKDGMNVRLASDLTRSRINVMDSAELEERSIKETNRLIELFQTKLEVSEDVAKILVDEGVSSVEDIAHADIGELVKIEEFDQNLAEALHSRANDYLLENLLGADDEESEILSFSDIGVDERVLTALKENGIESVNDFADLSVFELIEIVPDLDEKQAGNWIMAAREPLLRKAKTQPQRRS